MLGHSWLNSNFASSHEVSWFYITAWGAPSVATVETTGRWVCIILITQPLLLTLCESWRPTLCGFVLQCEKYQSVPEPLLAQYGLSECDIAPKHCQGTMGPPSECDTSLCKRVGFFNTSSGFLLWSGLVGVMPEVYVLVWVKCRFGELGFFQNAFLMSFSDPLIYGSWCCMLTGVGRALLIWLTMSNCFIQALWPLQFGPCTYQP